MSKKWNSRGPSAFSSAIAVMILLSAGAAVAQQGGLQRLAAGAQDAIAGRDHSMAAQERRVALPASPTATHSQGVGSDVGSASGTGTSADTCTATVAAVRAEMPAAGDSTGLAHALSVLETNCTKNPQAQGLINAIGEMGHGKGHTTASQSGGGGKPATSPPNSQGGGGGKGKSGR